ncbi:MAG: VTC domain-containing protein, partial [Planctomycetota bacterium]
DPHAAEDGDGRYPVMSIYLDSPTGELLRSTLNRRVTRYKLRVRMYHSPNGSGSNGTAFFEIKRKSHVVVNKTRGRAPRSLAESLLWQETAHVDLPGGWDSAAYESIHEFQMLRSGIRARPVIGVSYSREAYEGQSANRIRVTLDRHLQYGQLAPRGSGLEEVWCPAIGPGVILEVKFTDTYPFWVADMLHRVGVLRRGVCKFVICSRAAGRSEFAPSRGNVV